ncbi:MAG: ATP-binding protein [Rhodospirillales bacterium]|nr:ATP-binding protein [Rhodospirillales bacterium]
MGTIKHFKIENLFGSRNINLPLSPSGVILIGPNGTGKSTVINIFYFFITQQWDRLLQYQFDSIAIEFNKTKIDCNREDISHLGGVSRFIAESRPSSKVHRHLTALQNNNLFDEFISTKKTDIKLAYYADILSTTSSDVSQFHRFITRRFSDEDLFSSSRKEISKQLKELYNHKTIYLPTYRRIEKDINEVFPDFEQKMRRYFDDNPSTAFTRNTSHYMELVSFGMDDVKKIINRTLKELKDFSLHRYNELSANYLKEVIRGDANKFKASEIKSLKEDDLLDVLARVSEDALSTEDKDLLKKRIRTLQDKRKKDFETDEQYLAHYFTKLVYIYNDLKEKESEIVKFINVCNRYLRPGKEIKYKADTYDVEIINIYGDRLDFSDLSSGEKQVISIFSHLFLDGNGSKAVIIDEPELSLSVPWQKILLEDIVNSGHCSLLVGVTHSPFIYDNSLDDITHDLRHFIK